MKFGALDYETKKIESRPVYPPVPVGCALYPEGGARRYLAWGHPRENNITKRDATREIKAFIKSHKTICHNLPFDHEVGAVHLNAPIIHVAPEWHDTEILAYLAHPRAESMALKALAEAYLNMPPDEQEELRDWICEHVPEVRDKMKGGKPPKNWGAYIAHAPGKLCGRYANGDTWRTMKLFKLFFPLVRDGGMLGAYQRDLRVIDIKLSMEQAGVNTAHNRLKRDLPKFKKARDQIEERVKRRLKISKAYELNCPKGFFNFNSGQQVADALEHAGKVDPDYWVYTDPSDSYPEGQRSTSLENLKIVCKDKALITDLGMRSVLSTYAETFLGPWIETGKQTGGRIHPTFNTIRTTDEHGQRGTKGTKTGRPSSSNPNFNNIPANAEDSKNSLVLLALQKYLRNQFDMNFLGLRDYIVPDDGCIWIDRDYRQQEFKVLAHYENGPLMEAYQSDPLFDVHKMVGEFIRQLFGFKLKRKAVKIIAFMEIYGSGLDHLAFELGVTRAEAQQLRTAYRRALPGVRDLSNELKRMVKEGVLMRTWGGRLYDCEESVYSHKQKRWLDFEYKMFNLLIQGGSADITKQAMIQVDDACEGDIRLQVYDELLVNTDAGSYKKDMARMREGMEAIELDVPLPTDGEYSRVSWGRMKPFKEAA